jgi:hypothetical protein
MRRLTIAIPEEAAARLERLARLEFRDHKQQAARLLVDAIERAERTPPIGRSRNDTGQDVPR